MHSSSNTVIVPGALYKFVVRSADEAVQTIRAELGESAKVISVRTVNKDGWRGLFLRQRLEVLAQIPVPEPAPAALVPSVAAQDDSDDAILAVTPGNRIRGTKAAHPSLPDLLRRSGISESMLARLQGMREWRSLEDRPLHESFVDLARELRRQHELRPARPLPARVAFLGTPGCGRTTALCKWLAAEVFRRARTGAVVKAEFDRPNPAENLSVFCEALGLSLEHFPGPVPATENGAFLYVDMPGLSLNSPEENRPHARFLETEKIDGRVLVLNAAYDAATLRQGYVTGRGLGATHVVFTHLDEISHWGKLWDFLLDGELSPLFLSTGPSLTGDCEEAVISAILRKTLPGA